MFMKYEMKFVPKIQCGVRSNNFVRKSTTMDWKVKIKSKIMVKQLIFE